MGEKEEKKEKKKTKLVSPLLTDLEQAFSRVTEAEKVLAEHPILEALMAVRLEEPPPRVLKALKPSQTNTVIRSLVKHIEFLEEELVKYKAMLKILEETKKELKEKYVA